MKAKESSKRTYMLCAAMLAVWFGVGVLFVPVATNKRLIAPAWAGEGSAFPKAQNAPAQKTPLPAQPDPGARGRVLASYGKLPLSFEPNQGQTDGRVKFLSRGSGYTLYLTTHEAVLALRKASPPNPAVAAVSSPPSRRPAQSAISSRELLASWSKHGDEDIVATLGAANRQLSIDNRQSVSTMRLLGANPPKVRGLEQLPGKSNYFIGNDPTKWRTQVPNYARVQNQGIYPGVDLVYYGHQGQLEYDFVVAPGADPRLIRLAFEGAGQMKLGAEGDLVLTGEGGEVRFQKPVVYQLTGAYEPTRRSDGVRGAIDGRYVLEGKNRVSFELGAYDRSKPLVIDPSLSYSTYLGGSSRDFANGIAVDSAGNAYVNRADQFDQLPDQESFPRD